MWRPRSRLPASAVRSDGSFTLAPPLLQTLAGGALADGAHALHLEATDKAGDLSRLDLSFIRDTTAATMSGALAHDTGASGSDGLTKNPEVAGTVTDANGIPKFSGALNRGASRAVTSVLQPDGSFTLTPALLKTLAGGALRDGAHTLHLVATDKAGKTSSLDMSFVLDTKIAPPSFDITPASDSGKKRNHATTVIPVALQGSTDPNAQVTLVGKGLIAGPAGDFRFDNVRLLALGDNNFTAQATDSAGNQSSYALTIALDKSHAAVADANSDGKQDAGDTTNTGNVTLSTLSVTDDNGTPDIHTDDFTLSINGSLAPGASTMLTSAPRVLTQGDFDTGSVTNIATDQGTGGSQTVTATATDTVTLQQSPAITGVTSGTDMTAPSITAAVGDEFVGPFPSWINIKTAYGAKGDGITDDTAAFQRALTELGTAGHGNVLWIPAGTYKITSQLTLFSRLGVSIIGEDPARTILKWAGPGVFSTNSTTGSMFVINSVAYSRFDRLTFDGSGSPIVLVDQVWDGVSNYFATGNEYADDNFQNANIGIRGGLEYQPSAGGSSETSILRDHFTNLKVIGVITMNFNALDWWVRDSIFDHDMNGVGNWVPNPDGTTYINGAGNVSVYNSIFRYSTMADISLGNTAPFAIRDDYSIGSWRFLNSAGINATANTTLQGNTILDTTDPISVFGGNAGPYVMMDNVIRSKSTVSQGPVVWVSDFLRDTDLTAIGNTFTVPSPMYTSGRLVDIDNSIVSPNTINPSEPTLPPTEPNMHGPVVEVAVGSSDIQIQQAINFAVAQYNGQRPVVHIPAGTYNLSNTVTIPANSDVQLVGDGMFATVLVYTGSGSGPTAQIQGPSHATLRDIGLNGSHRVDALDVTNIDQPGSRVFIFKSVMGGATNANLFFDGLDYTTVDVEDVQNGGERGGADVRVVGGPLAAAGNPQGGELRIFSGVGGGDQAYTSNIDVSNGGTLLSRDVWFDGGPPPYLHVTQGTVTIDNGHVWMNLTDYPQSAPAVDLSNLNGKVTLLNTDIGNSTVISGDGTNAQVLGLAVLRDQPAPTGSYFYNNASPAATAGLLNSRQWTTLPDRQSVPTPNQGTIDSTFVTSMIAQARGDHAPMLTPIADGVSDVRLFRVKAEWGTNNILLAPASIATTHPAIALDKSHAAVADANGDGRQDAGDTVTYSYLVTNTGNVTLSNLSVTDDNGTPRDPTDDFTISINGSLAPGASATLTSAPRVLTQGDFNTGSVTNIATDQGTGGGQTVTATDTDTVTLQQNPQIDVPIVTTGTPQFNFPNSVDKIQPKVGGGASFTFNPGGYIYWDLYSSDVSKAQIKLDSGTTAYTGLAVSIVQVWGSNGIGANTGEGIYRVYVTDNTANTSVSLDNSHLIVSYSIVNGSGQPVLSTDKGIIDLVNADPLIVGNNIQNALTNASNGFTINPAGTTGTAGVDKDWTSPDTSGTATGETAKTFDAVAGNDALYGRNNTSPAGDTLSGGAGNNLVDGRDGNDIIDMSGQSGNNYLYGGLGNDTLKGGSGNDTLVGSYGVDTLTGNAGSDVFILQRGGIEKITDFTPGTDKLWVGTFNGTATPGATFSAAGLAGAPAGTDAVYDPSNGSFYFDPDGTGTGVDPVLVAVLAKNLPITSADVVIDPLVQAIAGTNLSGNSGGTLSNVLPTAQESPWQQHALAGSTG